MERRLQAKIALFGPLKLEYVSECSWPWPRPIGMYFCTTLKIALPLSQSGIQRRSEIPLGGYANADTVAATSGNVSWFQV